ncbi:MAG: tryptophan--tRNA ligase [Candidatus Babeliaceae bacterium]|jgi:tryptophanyl-tRNA synthetase
METKNKAVRVLTGDRPTGPLHLGHYVGSLANRIMLQEKYDQYVMIADVQALTDNYEDPGKVRRNVTQVALDYLAVGIDPEKTTIFIQSLIPEIAELTIFFLNLVSINRVTRNPTVKTELKQKGFGEHVPAGFVVYPISQAADITIVKGHIVPVGEDQLPMIEQTNEIVRTFNRLYSCNVFPEVEALVPKISRLCGTDGHNKMSKSLNNAIYLSDSADTVVAKVKSMYTDPGHIHVSDPGKVEGNTVFTYLDVFDPNIAEVAQLKEHYQRGGLGDMILKKRLAEILNTFLEPIRERRKQFEQDPEYAMRVLLDGTAKTRLIAQQTMHEVRQVMHLDY